MIRIICIAILIGVVVADLGYYFGIRRCKDQLPNDYSPYCVTCYINKADAGDPAAMFNLALYYSGRNQEKSYDWLKKAVKNGNENAILRALDDYKTGMLRRRDVEKYLTSAAQVDPKKMSAEAKYFYLGGYGGPVDLERARNYSVENDNETLPLCKVATRYGELVNAGIGQAVERKEAIELLRMCVIKLDTADIQYTHVINILSKIEFAPDPK